MNDIHINILELNYVKQWFISFYLFHNLADQWNGIIGDLVTGSADMSFAPLSVSK